MRMAFNVYRIFGLNPNLAIIPEDEKIVLKAMTMETGGKKKGMNMVFSSNNDTALPFFAQ